MIVGVPAEVKVAECRVAITPDGVRGLTALGHQVLVETGAGTGSSLSDADFVTAGATLVDAAAAWSAELVCKVKEPQESELSYLRPGLVLFTYLHLAAYPGVARALLESGTTGVAYETVQLPSGGLPLLAPMSEVAGRIATQVGAHYLEASHGTRGILLGGVPGVRPARVVIIGAGHVGWNAAWIAQGMEAEVLLLDRDIDRLRWVDQIHQGRIVTLASNHGSIERAISEADLVIGAVLVAGGRAPIVVTEEMIAAMRPGSVIVDVAVDQGGCVETTHETTHENPTYFVHGVLHYAVGNMPAAVPHTSTYALTNATFPYLLELVEHGVGAAATADPALRGGMNTIGGNCTNAAVAAALDLDWVDPMKVVSA
ncbi:MAG: alanine dehydrogenase [Acidimicrobiales bacterium]|jgi:alanine dehydrogenase